MRAFTIRVSKCLECPFVDPEDDTRAGSCCYIHEGSCAVYKQNKNGITQSCPLFDKCEEVSDENDYTLMGDYIDRSEYE